MDVHKFILKGKSLCDVLNALEPNVGIDQAIKQNGFTKTADYVRVIQTERFLQVDQSQTKMKNNPKR